MRRHEVAHGPSQGIEPILRKSLHRPTNALLAGKYPTAVDEMQAACRMTQDNLLHQLKTYQESKINEIGWVGGRKTKPKQRQTTPCEQRAKIHAQMQRQARWSHNTRRNEMNGVSAPGANAPHIYARLVPNVPTGTRETPSVPVKARL